VNVTVQVADAYSHCEAVTRKQAANFFYGIRLLPRVRRRAMCAAYAFARRVDDIGDGTLSHEEKLRLLDREARALQAISAAATAATPAVGADAEAGAAVELDGGEDLVMVALADAQRRFSLPVDALGELIEGVRMDIASVTYESFDELVPYCRRVAGAIGRVCLAIFGLREPAGPDAARAQALADDLGVALQLTNILRDVREDAQNGRVYLPAEDLRRFGVLAADEPPRSLHETAEAVLGALERANAGVNAGVIHSDGHGGDGDGDGLERLTALVRFEAERAAQWFDHGLQLAPLLDRRSAACVLAMAGIYRRLLERIDAHPEEAVSRRMSLPAHEKAWVAARVMLRAGA
jgi:phytoene synthase